MIDLTGANLVSYLMRVVKDAVSRNPRFRNTLGEVTFASNNQVNWGDVQVLIKSVTTSGTRLSPDYFMCTQHGRAILAKVGDKEGAFVEWVTENDKTRLTPKAGVYYFNVDAVNEQTRDVNLTVQQYRWEQGSLKNAMGSIIALASGIDGNTLTATDAITSETVDFTTFLTSGAPSGTGLAKFLYLLSPCTDLVLEAPGVGSSGPTILTPNVDYWVLRQEDAVLIKSTRGGQELVTFPANFTTKVFGDLVSPEDELGPQIALLANYTSITFFDQDGFELRKDLDYNFQGPNAILLSSWTPAGSMITARAILKLNPHVEGRPATNSENIIKINVGPTEELTAATISTPAGDFSTVDPTPSGFLPATLLEDGTILLSKLLLPGDWLQYEARILTSNYTVVGKKYELNGFKKTVWDPKAGGTDANTPAPGAYVIQLDANGQPTDPIPGMVLAIGDAVVKGDQCAVIVNPELTETYEVFGSKENLTFVLDCKSNDFQTSSDISELLKRELLVMRRQNMEADGVTIFEATRENLGEQRDPSGTAPRHIFTVSVSASADWKVFIPCVTRLVSCEITEGVYLPDYLGKISMAPRMQAFGAFQFIPSYA